MKHLKHLKMKIMKIKHILTVSITLLLVANLGFSVYLVTLINKAQESISSTIGYSYSYITGLGAIKNTIASQIEEINSSIQSLSYNTCYLR